MPCKSCQRDDHKTKANKLCPNHCPRAFGPVFQPVVVLQRSAEGLPRNVAERIRRDLRKGKGEYWTLKPGDHLKKCTFSLKGFAADSLLASQEVDIEVEFPAGYPFDSPSVCCSVASFQMPKWSPSMSFDVLATTIVADLSQLSG